MSIVAWQDDGAKLLDQLRQVHASGVKTLLLACFLRACN